LGSSFLFLVSDAAFFFLVKKYKTRSNNFRLFDSTTTCMGTDEGSGSAKWWPLASLGYEIEVLQVKGILVSLSSLTNKRHVSG
jgi:hypothetical protein